jgi:hypothetical protein
MYFYFHDWLITPLPIALCGIYHTLISHCI